MEVIRLPGIHHDTSISIVAGSKRSILIDSGTSWYQVNVEERIKTKINDLPNLEAILLTHRHYDTAGGAKFLSKKFNVPILIHSSASNSLLSNDQLTTWASRYDSDMPETETVSLEDGWEMDLGGGSIKSIHTPGHTSCHSSFLIPQLSILFTGDLILPLRNVSRLPKYNSIAPSHRLQNSALSSFPFSEKCQPEAG